MLSEGRLINKLTEQMKRSKIAEKKCFTDPDEVCYLDYKNDDCWCYRFCFDSAKHGRIGLFADILQSSEN